MTSRNSLSVVIPVFNEGAAVTETVAKITDQLSRTELHFEIIVVNDGSTDDFPTDFPGVPHVRIIENIQNMGYGFSLKRGIAEAVYDSVCILDADGTYPIDNIVTLYESYKKGFDMVVGARTGPHVNTSLAKLVARKFFIFIAEFTTGRHIKDINSGFRIFRRDVAMRYREILSSGFSFTSTITILFMQDGLFVKYLDIPYYKRSGRTKVKHFRDALRSLQLILNCILVANPLKLYLLFIVFYLFFMLLPLAVTVLSPPFALVIAIGITGAFLMLSFGCLAVQSMLNRKLEKAA